MINKVSLYIYTYKYTYCTKRNNVYINRHIAQGVNASTNTSMGALIRMNYFRVCTYPLTKRHIR